jgi:hypothetical protein
MSRTLVILVFATFLVIGLFVLGGAADDAATDPNSSVNDTYATGLTDTGTTLYGVVGPALVLVLVLGMFYAYARQGFG